MPRKAGGTRRKRRTHKLPTTDEKDDIPRSFVFRRGRIPAYLRTLISDVRNMLMPHTAVNLRERKMNNLKDYVSVAGKLSITHFWMLSATSLAPYLRIGKVPQGPTLNFRILEYSLCSHIKSMQRRPHVLGGRDFEEPPLLVMNNMKEAQADSEMKIVNLVAETFRHSFPPLDVSSVDLGAVRRVLLVQRDKEKGCYYLRHYAIKVVPSGLSRPVRKIVTKRKVPKLGRLGDVAEVMDGGAGVWSSDSEAEMGDVGKVTLAQGVRGLKQGSKSRVKLIELGPRLTLDLVKITAGLCDGEVIYHKLVEKTEQEAEANRERIESRQALKRKRREEQEENVRRKKEVKRAKKERHKRNVEARIQAEKEAEEMEQMENDDHLNEGDDEHKSSGSDADDEDSE